MTLQPLWARTDTKSVGSYSRKRGLWGGEKKKRSKSEQSITSEADQAHPFLLAQALTSRDALEESCCLHCFSQKLPAMENLFLQQEGHCIYVYMHTGTPFWLADVARKLGCNPKLWIVLGTTPELWAVRNSENNLNSVAERPCTSCWKPSF